MCLVAFKLHGKSHVKNSKVFSYYELMEFSLKPNAWGPQNGNYYSNVQQSVAINVFTIHSKFASFRFKNGNDWSLNFVEGFTRAKLIRVRMTFRSKGSEMMVKKHIKSLLLLKTFWRFSFDCYTVCCVPLHMGWVIERNKVKCFIFPSHIARKDFNIHSNIQNLNIQNIHKFGSFNMMVRGKRFISVSNFDKRQLKIFHFQSCFGIDTRNSLNTYVRCWTRMCDVRTFANFVP